MAVEFRHPSWHAEEISRLLEQREVAYCVVSGAQLPGVLLATAAFVQVRLAGPDPHRGSYSECGSTAAVGLRQQVVPTSNLCQWTIRVHSG